MGALMMDPAHIVNVGIVGCGNAAWKYARGLGNDGVNIAIVHDLQRARAVELSALLGASVATTLDEFASRLVPGSLAQGVACVLTPMKGRPYLIRRLLESGLHVFSEKPMGSSQEARELRQLAATRQLHLLGAPDITCGESIREISTALSSNRYGRLRSLEMRMVVPHPTTWHSRPDSLETNHGGLLGDLGLYPISIALLLAGPCQVLTAQQGSDPWRGGTVFRLGHASGVETSVELRCSDTEVDARPDLLARTELGTISCGSINAYSSQTVWRQGGSEALLHEGKSDSQIRGLGLVDLVQALEFGMQPQWDRSIDTVLKELRILGAVARLIV